MLPALAIVLLILGAARGQEKDFAFSGAVLPPVSATALDKTKLKFPQDFSAPLNLLVLSFARNQQEAVGSWLSAANDIPSAAQKMAVWALPVSSRQNNLYKWWLDSSMRSSLPTRQPLHSTVPLYVNKPQFLRSLQISSEKEIAVVLTDRAGHVVWRSTGTASQEKKGSLATFLKKKTP